MGLLRDLLLHTNEIYFRYLEIVDEIQKLHRIPAGCPKVVDAVSLVSQFFNICFCFDEVKNLFNRPFLYATKSHPNSKSPNLLRLAPLNTFKERVH